MGSPSTAGRARPAPRRRSSRATPCRSSALVAAVPGLAAADDEGPAGTRRVAAGVGGGDREGPGSVHRRGHQPSEPASGAKGHRCRTGVAWPAPGQRDHRNRRLVDDTGLDRLTDADRAAHERWRSRDRHVGWSSTDASSMSVVDPIPELLVTASWCVRSPSARPLRSTPIGTSTVAPGASVPPRDPTMNGAASPEIVQSIDPPPVLASDAAALVDDVHTRRPHPAMVSPINALACCGEQHWVKLTTDDPESRPLCDCRRTAACCPTLHIGTA
jgi:hypothetical protein